MKEEDNILKKVGKENVFRVPDGYFENLTSEVMSRLPEKETPAIIKREPTKWERIKPWVYMTAMFAGAALISALLLLTVHLLTTGWRWTNLKPKLFLMNISVLCWIILCWMIIRCMSISQTPVQSDVSNNLTV